MDVYLEKTVPDEDLPPSCITVSSPVVLFDDYIIHGSGALPDHLEKDYTRILITLGNETEGSYGGAKKRHKPSQK
jgi:hypothetical protein